MQRSGGGGGGGVVEVEGGGGGWGAGELAPASAPARALLGCTQSQPNKKPFIGRVQLSQTGWEHVAFKNEEGGMRGGVEQGGTEWRASE